MSTDYDVLIVGGGPAGLSAALSLGRMNRTALICDDGDPRNISSKHVHNFPSRDGVNPEKFRKKIKRDLEKYKTINFFNGCVNEIEKCENIFRTKFSNDKILTFERVILAHGIGDNMPDVPGFSDLWGKSVFNCPYCHGFEVSNQPLGIVSEGKDIAHFVSLIFNLSKDLILFTNGNSNISDEFEKKLIARKIRVVDEQIDRLNFEGEKLLSVLLKNGETIERSALFMTPLFPFKMLSTVGLSLGCKVTEKGYYYVDNENMQTSVPGVFAAGDVAGERHSVLQACASGSQAGCGCVSSLTSFT